MTPTKRVVAALGAVGATLKRSKKHLVYELPNGNAVTVSSTPSDSREEQNVLRDIRRAVGAVDPTPKPSTTKNAPKRKPKPGRSDVPFARITASPLADALRSTGLVEQQLREQIAALESEVWNLSTTCARLSETHGREERAWRTERADLIAKVEELERPWLLRVWKWMNADREDA